MAAFTKQTEETMDETALYTSYVEMVNTLWRYMSHHVLSLASKKLVEHKRRCVVIDVDGTIVSTHPLYGDTIFKDVMTFLEQMRQHNIDVFIMTARESLHDIECILQKNDIPLDMIKHIYTCPPQQNYTIAKQARRSSIFMLQYCVQIVYQDNLLPKDWVIMKKQEQRNEIRRQGYTILACVGDSLGDLTFDDKVEDFATPYMTQNFLIPDPFISLDI